MKSFFFFLYYFHFEFRSTILTENWFWEKEKKNILLVIWRDYRRFVFGFIFQLREYISSSGMISVIPKTEKYLLSNHIQPPLNIGRRKKKPLVSLNKEWTNKQKKNSFERKTEYSHSTLISWSNGASTSVRYTKTEEILF